MYADIAFFTIDASNEIIKIYFGFNITYNTIKQNIE